MQLKKKEDKVNMNETYQLEQEDDEKCSDNVLAGREKKIKLI